MDDQGNMVYHPQQQLLYAGIKTEEAERLAAQPDGTYVEDTVIYSVQDVPASNWRVVGVSYIDETVNESFWQMARITLGSAALILVAALLVGWIISHMLSHPLQKLETAMEQFEQDADGFTFQPVAGTREVQELSDSFGHMVGRIQRLMNTVREEEIVLRKTELKALQVQINPHFLYNTLVKPERFEDASTIADQLNAKRTVVLNLESTGKEVSRRLIDFLSGVAYANNGQIKRVATSTFIITPFNVDIMGDLIDELENNGVFF